MESPRSCIHQAAGPGSDPTVSCSCVPHVPKPPCSTHTVGVSRLPPWSCLCPVQAPDQVAAPHPPSWQSHPMVSSRAASQLPWPHPLADSTVRMASRYLPVSSGDILSLLKYMLRSSPSLLAWRERGSWEEHPVVASLFLSSVTLMKSPLLLLLIRDKTRTADLLVWSEDIYLTLLPN